MRSTSLNGSLKLLGVIRIWVELNWTSPPGVNASEKLVRGESGVNIWKPSTVSIIS